MILDFDLVEVDVQELSNTLHEHDHVKGWNQCEICAACGSPIINLPYLWITYQGLHKAMDLFIHKNCLDDYIRLQKSLHFSCN